MNCRIFIFLNVLLVLLCGCNKRNPEPIKNGVEAREVLELVDVPEKAEGAIIRGRGYCGWIKMKFTRQQFEMFLLNNGIRKNSTPSKREKVVGRLSEINFLQNKEFFQPETKLSSWIDDRHYTIGVKELPGGELEVYLIVYRD